VKALLLDHEVVDDEFFTALALRLSKHAGVTALGEWSHGLKYGVRMNGCRFIAIIEPEEHDGRVWRHLSVSCATPPRVPDWRELGYLKELFLGDEKAVMVFPRKAEYVNDHPHVLHLFSGPDGLPDFRSEYPVDGRPSI
jgi:hypothetical protein